MISFTDLIERSTTCQYIGQDSTAHSTRLEPTCCTPSLAGRSYCEEHLWCVYQKGSATARRKKDERVAAAVWDIESEFNAALEELEAEGFEA
jgi:hypothetical protein